METRNVGGVGISIIRDACSAGADIGAVLYRGSILQILEMRAFGPLDTERGD
jgi:hypothetical protein